MGGAISDGSLIEHRRVDWEGSSAENEGDRWDGIAWDSVQPLANALSTGNLRVELGDFVGVADDECTTGIENDWTGDASIGGGRRTVRTMRRILYDDVVQANLPEALGEIISTSRR